MPVRFWTLEIENKTEICLIINGKKISEILANKNVHLQSSVVTDILDGKDDSVKVKLEGKEFTLSCHLLRETRLFGCLINDKQSLLHFWNDTSEFLGQISDEETDEDDDSLLGEQNLSHHEKEDRISTSSEAEAVDVLIPPRTEVGDKTFDDGRKMVFSAINKKSAGKHFVDIFTLKEPPTEYEVRTRDEDFVAKLAEQMIEKRDISMDNAANIIGTVQISKSNFDSKGLSTYQIYVIDGNHNVRAQQIAYQKTKDLVFKYREVHIYCNLTSEEALILGTSRNEDSCLSLKLNDFQKVDLVRRYLYLSSDVQPNQEPPEGGSKFTQVYKQLLNLKTKSQVDSKAVIRFLATKLSSRNYEVFSAICKKNPKLKASKFEPLRGLEEADMNDQLKKLEASKCKREDWIAFKEKCAVAKKEKLQVKNNTTATVVFSDFKAEIITNDRTIASGCISIAFNSSDGKTKVMTIRELEDSIFGKDENKEDTRSSSSETNVPFDVLETPFSNNESRICTKSKEGGKHKLDEQTDDASKKKKSKGIKDGTLIDKTSNKLRRSPRKNDRYRDNSFGNVEDMSPVRPKEKASQLRRSPRKTGTPAFELRRSPRKAERRNVYSFGSDDELSPFKTKDLSICRTNTFAHSTPFMRAYIGQTTPDNESKDASYINDNATESSVDAFLRIMVTEDAYLRAKFLKGTLVEEEDVETMPENLTQLDLLLDSTIQSSSKKYFSEDAWMVVINTLNMLKVTPIKKISSQKTFNQTITQVLPLMEKKTSSPKTKQTIAKDKRTSKEGHATSRPARVRLTDIASVKDITKYAKQKCLKKTTNV